MSHATSSSPRPRPTAGNQARLLFLVFAAAAVLVVLAYMTVTFGRIQGEEFSPDLFGRREFAYYEVPLLGWQVWPVTRSDTTGPLEKYLRDKKLIPLPASTPEPRWDLVSATRGWGGTRSVLAFSEAKILCYYLDARNADGKHVWHQWSEEHPLEAQVLWPAVTSVAKQQLYLFTPDLLWLAAAEPSAERLRQRMAALLCEKYCLLADSHQRLGRHETAVELYTEALTHVPGHAVALAGRSQSLATLGRSPDRAPIEPEARTP